MIPRRIASNVVILFEPKTYYDGNLIKSKPFGWAKIRNPNVAILNKSEIRIFKCPKLIHELQSVN